MFMNQDALSLEEPQKTRMLHLRQQVLLRIEEVRAKRLSILDSFQVCPLCSWDLTRECCMEPITES